MQSPILTLLRRLEAQNVWRVGYQAMPQQGFSTAMTPSSTLGSEEVFGSGELMRYPRQGASIAAPEWYEDTSMSAQEALKLLVNHIRDSGPVKQRHLQYLYQRCQNADELEKALRLTRLNYLARGELRQHDSFSHRTSAVLLGEAMRVGAPDIARKALLQGQEYGLAGPNTRAFNRLLVYHSKNKDLERLVETYELMKRAGPRPDSETCFVMVKGLVDGQRPDLAGLVIREFEIAGVRVRDGTRRYIETHGGPEAVHQATAAVAALQQRSNTMMPQTGSMVANANGVLGGSGQTYQQQQHYFY